jgi:uncharacterized membrane protein required for colicin V production
MTTIDIVLGSIMIYYMYSGFKSGFIKKIVGLAVLAIALILATKFSADLSEGVFQQMGFSERIGFIASFILIILLTLIVQAILNKMYLNDLEQSTLNKIFGIFIGVVEGGLVVSITLILMTIYLKLPSDEIKSGSLLYKPIKNFAPMVYDSMNTFLPESEDFYQQIFKQVSQGVKKAEGKFK